VFVINKCFAGINLSEFRNQRENLKLICSTDVERPYLNESIVG
jgi:hypothetical protein